MGHGIVNIGGAPKHASRHAAGAADALAPGDIGAAAATHASQHATDGSDPIPPASLGAAELVGGIVKASQARTAIIVKSESFTLSAAETEASIWCENSAAAVVTIPSDAGLNIPIGSSYHVIRASGPVSFALQAGVSVLVAGVGWVTSGTAASISSIGESAYLIRINGAGWSLACG